MEIEPFLCGFQSGRRQRALMLPATYFSLNQPGIFQNLHVFADGRFTDLKGRRQLADGATALCKSCKDAAAGAVRKGEKDPVKLLAGLLHEIIS